MKDAAPQTIYLADYTPFGFIIESVQLTFHLHPTQTRVISKIAFRPIRVGGRSRNLSANQHRA